MPRPDKYTFAALAALAFSGAEVLAMYYGLKTGPLPYLVFGILIAVVQPFLSSFVDGVRRRWAINAVSALMLLAVLIVSAGRFGDAISAEEAQRSQTSRASTLASETARDVSEVLAIAKKKAKAACDRNENGKACTVSSNAVTTLLKTSITARTTIAETPDAVKETKYGWLSAASGGYVSERQASLFMMFFLPLVSQLAAASCYRLWGEGRQLKPKMVRIMPQRSVVKVLSGVVRPAEIRDRVELADVYRGYVKACKESGEAVAPGKVFGAQASEFAHAARLRVLESDGKIYWCGVRLAK